MPSLQHPLQSQEEEQFTAASVFNKETLSPLTQSCLSETPALPLGRQHLPFLLLGQSHTGLLCPKPVP